MFDYFFKKPSNNRDWQEDLIILPYTEVTQDAVTIHNIRNFKYRSEFDFEVNYYDRNFDLTQLEKTYVGIVRFSKNPLIIHVLLKFQFQNDELIFSAEVRKTKGQKFIAWRTLLRDYELIYLFGSSSDLIDLRENHRINEKVEFYQLNIFKEESAQLLKILCTRANLLKDTPEFFNLYTNNCAVNVIKALNQISKRKLPLFYPFRVIKSLNNWTIQQIQKAK